MTDQWQDDDDRLTSAPVRDDDGDTPDDWEAELEEKPKASDVEEKAKASSATKKPSNKKKSSNEKDSQKVVHQPEGDFTPEQLDEMQKKGELTQELDKLDMVTDLIDKEGAHQSLDNMNLLTREEFLNYSLRLSNHLDIVSKSEFYPEFMDHFLNGITKPMSTDSVKRLAATLQAITIRKQSEEREKKSKSKPKKQSKPQLKPVRQTDYGAFGDDDDHDVDYDDDDFM